MGRHIVSFGKFYH